MPIKLSFTGHVHRKRQAADLPGDYHLQGILAGHTYHNGWSWRSFQQTTWFNNKILTSQFTFYFNIVIYFANIPYVLDGEKHFFPAELPEECAQARDIDVRLTLAAASVFPADNSIYFSTGHLSTFLHHNRIVPTGSSTLLPLRPSPNSFSVRIFASF